MKKTGFQYALSKTCSLFAVLFALAAVVLTISYFIDGGMGSLAGGGISMASMALLGNIEDVSDRDTHGSDISYIVYLVAIDQIDRSQAFPQPNASREVAAIPLKSGEVPHYFEAHDIPTFTGTTEKGDITTTGENTFTIIMGGARVPLYNFIEEYSGGKFILFFKHVKNPTWYILGELERPCILANTETKDDKDGRYTTFTFTRSSVDLPLVYAGNPAVADSVNVAAEATTIPIVASANNYVLQNGTAVVAAVSGLSASDKGRYITIFGAGTTAPPTIADNSTFVLVDGATWTAKSGSSLTLRVLDASTLVEVSRVQTA